MRFFVEVSFFTSDGTHFLLSKSFDSFSEVSSWVAFYLDCYSEFKPTFDIFEPDDDLEVSN